MDFELIKNKIESIKSNNQMLKVFKIIHKNKEIYKINESGLYIPLNLLKSKTINELNNCIQNNTVINPSDSLNSLKYLKKMTLSHSEKLLLNKINLNCDLL